MVIVTNSAQDTVSLGKSFFPFLKEKDVVLLEGDLGGGKTTFIKGVLKGTGFKGRVLSPSFTLLRQYHARRKVINHIDLYRLDFEDTFSFGLEDYLYARGSFTLIEWGEKIEDFITKYIKVKFLLRGQNKRSIHFSVKGYDKSRIKRLKETLGSELIGN
jgi:tRNA threonylcarbamoyladenosine biosynthesis protein TsaE